MTPDELHAVYTNRLSQALIPISQSLQIDLVRDLEGLPHIDRVTARAKTVERFMAKAIKEVAGQRKYSDPIHQIQDQIGARVVVFYLDDVSAISTRVLQYFRPIEERDVVPDSEREFGYFGKHLILLLPDEIMPPGLNPATRPQFFELQIKTLFQHAFSEASHDLAYKPNVNLSRDQQRKVAFTAAQGWGADLIINELKQELIS